MKTVVALITLFAVALAVAPVRHLTLVKPTVQQLSPRTAPVAAVPRVGSPGSEVVVLKETLHNNDGLSGYQYAYELSDGSAREESAQVEARGVEDAVIRVRGFFRFVAQDGQTYTVTYVADENGFQPQGAHLPVPPQLH